MYYSLMGDNSNCINFTNHMLYSLKIKKKIGKNMKNTFTTYFLSHFYYNYNLFIKNVTFCIFKALFLLFPFLY